MKSSPKQRVFLNRLLSPSFWEDLSSFRSKEKSVYLKSDFWNLIAEDYDALEESPFYKTMQEDIILEMERRGALQRNFTFFDVCCGTGSYAIRIAPKVAQVYALDISPSMLEILSKKAREKDIRNLEIIGADWRNYKPPHLYDTVFVSMSPILRDLKEVRRLIQCARRFFIAVQWAGLRKNPLAEEVEKIFFKRKKTEENLGFFLIFNYLYTLGIPGDAKFYEGYFERKTTLEKFWKRLKFRLVAKGYNIGPKKERDILKFLEEKARDGIIETKTEVRIGALFLRIKEGKSGNF